MPDRAPIYIPTKGRSDYMITSKVLTELGLHHTLVVEADQIPEYQAAIERDGITADILELDMKFKREYELCDDLGLDRSTGPGPARNCAWEHAIQNGADYHWVMDDNIKGFWRFHKNHQIRCQNPELIRSMEDFVARYQNVGMAGPVYYMFAPRKQKAPPFITGTRIYSCNLIRNDLPFRWRGRYNEDTILSLDMLKRGWNTIQFYHCLQWKLPTQVIKGGNTDEFYHAEGEERKQGEKYAKGGTDAKSEMLARVHPDVAEVKFKFGRVHHQVDYSQFRKLPLVHRDGFELPEGQDNRGMKLRKRETG